MEIRVAEEGDVGEAMGLNAGKVTPGTRMRG